MILRKYRSSDCEKMAQLFYETVHSVNAADYTEEQLDAWADGSIDMGAWDRSFREHHTVVAVESREDTERIIGFGDMDSSGYLDRIYVHKDYQKKGVATALCDKLEARAFEKIVTHASITAKPFFEKRGYNVIKEQQVLRGGLLLTNYVMEKSI